GMLGVTFFGIFLTPVFFFVIDRLSHWHVFTQGPLARAARLILSLLQPRRWYQAGHWAAGRVTVSRKPKPAPRPGATPLVSLPAGDEPPEAALAAPHAGPQGVATKGHVAVASGTKHSNPTQT
ncbi:MAG: hypothetical protein ABUL64_04695, partial [Singulisphaera sp.]